MPDLSQAQIDERVAAGQASGRSRSRGGAKPSGGGSKPTFNDLMAQHRAKQANDPRYAALTSNVIENKALPIQASFTGGALGALAFGTSTAMAAPRSGQFSPILHAASPIARSERHLAGLAGGAAAEGIARTGAGTLQYLSGNRIRPNMSAIGGAARSVGRAGGRGLMMGKDAVFNTLYSGVHAGLGLKRGRTALALGALGGLGGYVFGSDIGGRLGDTYHGLFPETVNKNRLERIVKDLSQAQHDERVTAGQASGEARRKMIADHLGVSPDRVTARGTLRQRAYTPRARNEHGGFRGYSADEITNRFSQSAQEVQQHQQDAQQQAVVAGGSVRTGQGHFRSSGLGRQGRAVTRFLGEAAAPGMGPVISRAIGAFAGSTGLSDPETRYTVLGTGLGLAAGSALGMPRVRGAIARGAGALAGLAVKHGILGLSHLTNRAGVGHLARTARQPGLGGSSLARLAVIPGNWARWLGQRAGNAAGRAFLTPGFTAPIFGGLGAIAGGSIGRGIKESDRQSALADHAYRQSLLSR